MNQLESYLTGLAQIQANEHEQLAEFLLTSPGWKTLKLIYEDRLEVNEVLGEKLINLLVNTCAQLIVNLTTESRFHLSHQQNAKKSLYLGLFEDSLEEDEKDQEESEKNLDYEHETFKYSLRFSSSSDGTLLDLITICLSLYIRFNDGSSTSVLNDLNNNGSMVLNTFCQAIFTQTDPNGNLKKSNFIYNIIFQLLSQFECKLPF
jgi:hypothetical protein